MDEERIPKKHDKKKLQKEYTTSETSFEHTSSDKTSDEATESSGDKAKKDKAVGPFQQSSSSPSSSNFDHILAQQMGKHGWVIPKLNIYGHTYRNFKFYSTDFNIEHIPAVDLALSQLHKMKNNMNLQEERYSLELVLQCLLEQTFEPKRVGETLQ